MDIAISIITYILGFINPIFHHYDEPKKYQKEVKDYIISFSLLNIVILIVFVLYNDFSSVLIGEGILTTIFVLPSLFLVIIKKDKLYFVNYLKCLSIIALVIILSIVAAYLILNNVNPYRYLDDTLTKLANMTINQNTDILSLLPWNYKA